MKETTIDEFKVEIWSDFIYIKETTYPYDEIHISKCTLEKILKAVEEERNGS